MKSFKPLQKAKFLKSPKYLNLSPGLPGESKKGLCPVYLLLLFFTQGHKGKLNAYCSGLFPNERKKLYSG